MATNKRKKKPEQTKQDYERHRESYIKRASAWNKKNPEKRRNTLLKHNYGITLEDFCRMAVEQDYRCAICGLRKKLVVDHNHTTGQVRELLCGDCNRAFGIFKESRIILQKAAQYAIRHSVYEEDFLY